MVSSGKKHGINVISGIELDATYNGVNLHILGYGIHDDPRYHEYEAAIIEQEIAASNFKMEKIHELGIPFSRWQQVG